MLRYSEGDARTACRSPRWAIAARGIRPIRFRRAPSTKGSSDASTRSILSTAARPTATACRPNGSARAATGTTKFTAFGVAYGLDLFSNFTYFLDDPVNGDQFQQAERRFVGGRVSHRRFGRWAGRTVENTVGAQLRHDEIDRRSASITPRAPAARPCARTKSFRRAPAATRRTRRSGRRRSARRSACAAISIDSTSTPRIR